MSERIQMGMSPLALAAQLARERTGETITNYVVEARSRERPWITWPDGNTPTSSEEIARASYTSALASSHWWTQFRLVKRTAVITNEILEEGS
jgi:hypothetical protein